MNYPSTHNNGSGESQGEPDSLGARMRALRRSLGLRQTAFARLIGVAQSTTSKWEHNQQAPDRRALRHLASLLGRDIEDVMRSLGMDDQAPPPPLTVRVIGRLSASSEVRFYSVDRHANDGLPAPRWGNPLLVSIDVQSDCLGLSFNGWVAYFKDERRPPSRELYGQLCVVGLESGKILIKVVEPGRKRGHFDLYSSNERVQQDQRVVWASRILGMAPRPPDPKK